MEGRRVSEQEYSRRLPPPEAWRRPGQWLDLSTGLVKSDAPRLVLPTDDRGLVRPDEVVELVNDAFFFSDYDWPFTPGDQETAPDDHHFYYTARSYGPELHGGNTTPQRFRELPTHIGWMPRQFHNAIHDLTVKPKMPSMEVMEGYCDSYQLANAAFRRLIDAARRTTRASTEIGKRRRSIEMGQIIPSSPQDEVAQEFLQSFFAKHFEAYSQSVDVWRTLPLEDRATLEVPEMNHYKPHLVVKRLGRIATRPHINFVPVLRAA